MMTIRAMIDTNALIRFLGIELHSATDRPLDKNAHAIISDGLNTGKNVLFLNSISFIEIWANLPEDFSVSDKNNFIQTVKEFYNEEFLRIVTIDNEILENYISLKFKADKVREHDRIILASAVAYGCNSIITCDTSIVDLNIANGNIFQIY